MNEHTPGPWYVVDADGCTFGIVNDYGLRVVWLHVDSGEGIVGGIHTTPNARLIAAAPDLLATCQAAIAYDQALRACANDPDTMASYCTAQGDSLDTLYAVWMTKARAAIAKVASEETKDED